MANRATLQPNVFSSTNQPANNHGRPPGSRSVSTVLKEMLSDIAPDITINNDIVKAVAKNRTGKKVTIADAIAAKIIHESLISGESWAVKELMDRTEGKAPQSIEITQPDPVIAAQRVIDKVISKRGWTGKKLDEAIKIVAEEYNVPPESIQKPQIVEAEQ